MAWKCQPGSFRCSLAVTEGGVKDIWSHGNEIAKNQREHLKSSSLVDEEKFFFIEESQRINAEGRIVLESHHFTTP